MKIKACFAPRRDGIYGKVGGFEISADGTLDVPDDYAGKLIATGNFIEFNHKESMLITNGEETIDLMAMNKDELRELMTEVGVTIMGNPGEARIRKEIVQKLSA